MGIVASRFAAFAKRDDDVDEPLGEALEGALSDVSVDSVEAVRQVRERE